MSFAAPRPRTVVAGPRSRGRLDVFEFGTSWSHGTRGNEYYFVSWCLSSAIWSTSDDMRVTSSEPSFLVNTFEPILIVIRTFVLFLLIFCQPYCGGLWKMNIVNRCKDKHFSLLLREKATKQCLLPLFSCILYARRRVCDRSETLVFLFLASESWYNTKLSEVSKILTYNIFFCQELENLEELDEVN